MSQPNDTSDHRTRIGLWLPGLLVALGAAVATAHGLFEVARAAHTPAVIAGLYPLITDGLALVAYAATARLAGRGRRYAWGVVVLAAGLSGLAQASYLAHGAVSTSVVLRFGIGAWPAIAAATVAHLLYLILHADHAGLGDHVDHVDHVEQGDTDARVPEPIEGTTTSSTSAEASEALAARTAPIPLNASNAPTVQPAGVQPAFNGEPASTVQPPEAVQPEPVQPSPEPVPTQGPSSGSSARAKADRTARAYAARHGDWPTVSALVEAAEVSRGTAATALKALRDHHTPLHIVTEQPPSEAQQ